MSKEKSSSKAPSETPSASSAGKRRPAKSRSKQAAKTPHVAPNAPAAEKVAPAYPVFDELESSHGDETPEPAATREASSSEGAKRNKRRRKKSKGTGSQVVLTETPPEPGGDVDAPAQRPASQQARPKMDPENVAKLAWKIYLAEVSEEGVALIGDSDAKELARRCFRLAEIFMEEQSRRR